MGKTLSEKVNLDLEVTEALGKVGFPHVAAPLGVWRKDGTDLGMVQPYLALVGALLLALPVGWNRERHGNIMGVRTFPLVAVGACAYVLIARELLRDPYFPLRAARELGQDITTLSQADLRGLIAYVPQDPVMFHRTLTPEDPRWRSCDPDYTLATGWLAESLAFFKRHYNVVSLAQVLASRRSGTALPPHLVARPFSLVFADPPYALPALATLPDRLAPLLAPDGWLVLEHDPTHAFDAHALFVQARRYGRTVVSMFARDEG